MKITKSNSKVQMEMSEEDFELLTTMIFEFCDSIDSRKDKHGNYKNGVWCDCLELRDKINQAQKD